MMNGTLGEKKSNLLKLYCHKMSGQQVVGHCRPPAPIGFKYNKVYLMSVEGLIGHKAALTENILLYKFHNVLVCL